MKIIKFIPVNYWSCEICQKTHPEKEILDKRYFCSYKCSFRFIWRIFYGHIEQLYNGKDNFLWTWKEGYTDKEIKIYSYTKYPQFEKLPYNRKSWCFQLTKLKIEELRNG